MSRVSEITAILNELPKGYISIKSINNKKYYYLQYLENNKLISKYIKIQDLQTVKSQLLRRKELETELHELLNSGNNIPKLSASTRALTGFLMMEDRIVASFNSGQLEYIDEKYAPLYVIKTHNIKGFLSTRAIDTTRTNARLLKKALQIKDNENELISLHAYGATITDNYWFKNKYSKIKYKDICFDNDFYSDLALNGELILFPKTPKHTPELTTPGSYEKCWKKINGEWWLYKKGNKEEIFSELFVSKLAKRLNIPSAIYEQSGENIHTKNFANIYNFEPMISVAGDDDSYENVFNVLNNINSKLAKKYLLLIWFDSLVNNVDRHNENCGLLRNYKTGKIIDLAPNFDNNLALIARSKTLNLQANKDGFINFFIKFIKNNEIAKKYYKEMVLPKLNIEIINKCLSEIEIVEDNELIRKYLMNRHEYLTSFQNKLK